MNKPFLRSFLKTFHYNFEEFLSSPRLVPEGGLIGLIALLDMNLLTNAKVSSILDREYVREVFNNKANSLQLQNYYKIINEVVVLVENWIYERHQDLFVS